MGEVRTIKFWLRDPQLSAHAPSPLPAWLWSADGTRILWANPVGAAIFDAATPADLADRRFEGDKISAQVARLAETLPAGGPARLQRLRGFGAGFGRALVCACSQTVYGGQPAIFIAASEPAGPRLALAERARRLLADCEDAVAVYDAEGTRLYATPRAAEMLGTAMTLAAIGADALAAQAVQTGCAAGDSDIGAIEIERIGSGADTMLVALIGTATQVGETDRAGRDLEYARAVAAAALDTAAERRHPLRFVWQMDAEGRFGLATDEFAEIVGVPDASALNRLWTELAAELDLDPQGEVARAIATQNTWSGITVPWPVGGSDEPLMVELSGLPVFDRDRGFRGYRGFGICRDVARLSILMRARRAAPAEAVEGEQGARETLPAAVQEPSIAEEADRESPPQAVNVVPFRAVAAAEARTARLNEVERRAFREIGRELTARLRGLEEMKSAAATAAAEEIEEEPVAGSPVTARAPAPPSRPPAAAAEREAGERLLLDRLPVGMLIYRLDQLLYANRAFLEWTGYDTLAAFAEAGGLDTLFIEAEGDVIAPANGPAKTLTITTQAGGRLPVEGRLLTIEWDGETALALIFTGTAIDNDRKALEVALRVAEAENRELKAILDTATDGVILLDGEGRVLASNRSAEALFGLDARDLAGRPLADLFAAESRATALEYLERLRANGAASVLNNGCEVIGRVREGGLVPLFMTLGEISHARQKFCAVFRDITAWKKTEEELVQAKSEAERASSAKSEFLAKISHEIRTPLNAIIGFSEVMMSERFGPIGNERYLDYLKDIHASGGHVVSLINDLLDLSKIEAGKLDLAFTSVGLNDLVRQCVALMQPQANRERIIIRMSLSPTLPQVVADARSIRQIILNLLSNSIKFTPAGGQVIVSTGVNDAGEVLLRVRDTGTGMSEKDLQTALEPFRQLATSARWGASGSGLGLPLTKALTEANRANFNIKSAVEAGTLVEIAFPVARVLA
jgi:PAS domain S-box-containing protein